MKNALVDVHNKYRNEIALGNIPNYSSATNMATMQWDNDLANLCSLNVRQCDMVHDKSECTVTSTVTFNLNFYHHFFFATFNGPLIDTFECFT